MVSEKSNIIQPILCAHRELFGYSCSNWTFPVAHQFARSPTPPTLCELLVLSAWLKASRGCCESRVSFTWRNFRAHFDGQLQLQQRLLNFKPDLFQAVQCPWAWSRALCGQKQKMTRDEKKHCVLRFFITASTKIWFQVAALMMKNM